MAYKIKEQKRLELDSNPAGVVDAPQGTIGYFGGKKYKADGGTVWYEDVLEVNSIVELKGINDFKISDTVVVKSYYGNDKGGGGRFKLISKNGTLTDDNGGTIIIATNLDRWERLLSNPDKIDIRMFGAVEGVQFSNKKIPAIPVSPIGVIPDCTDAVNRAITWLDRDRSVFPASYTTFNIPSREIIVQGHYLIDPQGLDEEFDNAIVVPNGIAIKCIGQSSFHSNYNGVNFYMDGHFNLEGGINIYKKLWNGISNMEWYATATNPTPLDQYSAGIVLNGTRRCNFRAEALNFVSGLKLIDLEVEGNVDNVIHLGAMTNNRYGVDIRPMNGGWANQLIFELGAIRIMGSYVDRHPTIKTTCAAIYNNGNNNIFNNTNLEGSSGYDYAIFDNQGTNIYNNVRLEGTSAKVYVSNVGSTFNGGYNVSPNASQRFTNYDNISGTLDLTKYGYKFNLATRTAINGGGQQLLTGGGGTDPFPNSVSTILSGIPKESYVERGKDRFRSRFLHHGEINNGEWEIHTGVDEYVSLRERHELMNMFNPILHVEGEVAGVGDWIDDTLNSGFWYYATTLFVMGTDLASDITANNFQKEPTSQVPIRFKDRAVMSPRFQGLTTAIKASGTQSEELEGALYTPHGIYDNFSILRVNTANEKYNMLIGDTDFALNTDDTDLMLYSHNIVLRNLDSGGNTRNVYLTKKTIRYFAGREFMLYHAPQTTTWNYVSHPIVLKNVDGGDITLEQGDWVKIKALINDSTSNGTLIVTGSSNTSDIIKKVVTTDTYTLLGTDKYLVFNNVAGCKVTLPATVDSSQSVKIINECGTDKFVEFITSGSTIYQGESKALINGGKAEVSVLNTNLYGLTGDIIDGSFLSVYQSDFTTSLGLLSSSSPSTRTLALVSDEARLTIDVNATTLYVIFDVGNIPGYTIGKKYKLSLSISDFQHSGTAKPITLNYDGVNLSPTIAEGTTPLTQDYEFTATADTSLTILASNIGTLIGDFFSFSDINVSEKIFKVKTESYTNDTGTVVDLGQTVGGILNFASPSTATGYTLSNDTEAGGWRECYVDTTGMTAWTDITVTGSTFNSGSSVSFVAATNFRMVVRNINGTTIEHKFLDR